MIDNITLSPITYLLRIYNTPVNDDDVLGEYKSVATVSVCGDTACISGLMGSLSKSDYKNIFSKLSSIGIKRILWETHKNGVVIQKEVLVSDILK